MRDSSLMSPLRIAVVGSGGAGLAAAWALSQVHDVVLYEAAERLGGHANTVAVEGPRGTIAVDTGFIVYNEPSYPNFVRFLERLGVSTKPSDMSFSVSMDEGAYEYAGSLTGLFAQPTNLARLGHWRMVADILRFFRIAKRALDDGRDRGTLGAFLDRHGFSQSFRHRHLLPMAAAIWSAPTADILAFPLSTFLRFFDNHGLLSLAGRPQWRTLAGGSRAYVDAVAASLGASRLRLGCEVVGLGTGPFDVEVRERAGRRERFDQVVLACHADQALALLGSGATPSERKVLERFRYSESEAILHSDHGVMPKRPRAWSSWNYAAASEGQASAVSVSYWMNRLQGLDPGLPLFVSLNPRRDPAPSTVLGRFAYSHPLFDQEAIDAQAGLPGIQGRRGIWFCGSYCGYGFHEDAVQAGFAVAGALGAAAPWAAEVTPRSPASRIATLGSALPVAAE